MNVPESLAVSATFRPVVIDGYATGPLDIQVAGRRILSVPTQLGCRVGCTFCVSAGAPVVRNLRAVDMLEMVRVCLDALPPDGRPLELSFTGEGEALLNHRETAKVCAGLAGVCADFSSVRYCFSGMAASRLLSVLSAAPFTPRLQFSLHSARQTVRNHLVPLSEPLGVIEKTLRENASRFSAIELNVVLQDGVNDSDEDLDALATWGRSDWPVLLNPLLESGAEKQARRVLQFAQELAARGRIVRIYREVGARIARSGMYPMLTARPVSQAREAPNLVEAAGLEGVSKPEWPVR